jgi:hypothetical protein
MPSLSPAPKFSALNSAGDPAVGWKLYSYTAGTSTPKVTYSDFTLGAANPNPTILDARGEATVFLSGNYKLTLTDENDAVIWSVDDIRDLTTGQTLTNTTLAGTLTVTSTAVTWSGNPTHSGNHTFTNNVTVNGNTALGDSSADTLTIRPNAVTWSNNPTHSGNHTYSGTLTASLVAPVFTFGATFGNTTRAGVTVLDWYEEGTSTAVIKGTSTDGTATYGSNTITWQRVGNRVHFTLDCSWSSFTGTGNIKFTGLPYAPALAAEVCNVMASNLTFTGQLIAYTNAADAAVKLETLSTGAASAGVPVDAAGLVYISGSYKV